MFAIDDIVYLYGGINNFDELDKRLWYYNLTEEKWDVINMFLSPPPRFKHSGSLYCKDGDCYYTIFSGIYKIAATTQLIYLNDIWQYSFQTKSWITVDEIVYIINYLILILIILYY